MCANVRKHSSCRGAEVKETLILLSACALSIALYRYMRGCVPLVRDVVRMLREGIGRTGHIIVFLKCPRCQSFKTTAAPLRWETYGPPTERRSFFHCYVCGLTEVGDIDMVNKRSPLRVRTHGSRICARSEHISRRPRQRLGLFIYKNTSEVRRCFFTEKVSIILRNYANDFANRGGAVKILFSFVCKYHRSY